MTRIAQLVGLVPDQARVLDAGLEGELTTEQVANWFRSRCNHLDEEEYDFPATWAAYAQETFAILNVSGDVPEVQAWTQDEYWPSNQYEWFDVDQVPLGGYLLRVSATRTAWVFRRETDGSWRAYAFPNVG